jgi:siroheme synthase (precorrin-2 oxidase/ferrochelatase)
MQQRRSTLSDPLPPAFYPVSLNLVGRRCVVIGDDHEAIEKEEALREVGADVHVFADPSMVQEADVAEAFFVISTPQDATLSAWLRDLAQRHRFLLCTIDQPTFGFVAMQAIVKAGPTRIGISTGGAAPRVGKHLKLALQRALDSTFERFIDCLATQKLRNRTRIADNPAARRKAMIEAAEGFGVDITLKYPQWFLDELAALGPKVDTRE